MMSSSAKVEKNRGKFKKGMPRPEGSGRKAGTPNKRTADIVERISQSGVDIVQELLDIAKTTENEATKVTVLKIGRPTLMTPEITAKLEQAFSLGCTDEEACVYADIGKTTLYNYQNANPEFIERKALLKEKLV